MDKRRLLTTLFIWAIVAVYTAVELDHIIYFIESSRLFLFDSHYIGWYMSHPSGAVSLLTSFLIQLFYYPAIGAAVVGGLVAACYAAVDWSVRFEGRGDSFALAAAMSLWLVTYHSYSLFMQILVAVVVNLLLFKAMITNIRGSYYHAIALAMVGYLILGMAFVISVAMSLAYLALNREIGSKTKLVTIPLTVLMAAAAPYLATFIYPISTSAAYGFEDALLQKAIVTLSVVMVALIIYVRFAPQLKNRTRLIASAITLLISIVVIGSYINSNKSQAAIDVLTARAMAERGEWEQLLEKSREIRYKNHFLTYLRNVALYKTGQFNDMLFAYPQPYGGDGLYFPWRQNNNETPLGCYVYENTGVINEAHRWVYEQSTITEESGYTLKKLIEYNREMGRVEVADKFAALLNKSLFYSSDYSADIVSDTTYIKNQRLFISPDEFEVNMRQALEIDPRNSGASDYLMAYLLLMNRVTDFGAAIDIPKRIYGDDMPEIYNEAMLIYSQVSPEGFAASGYTIPEQTKSRFAKFDKLTRSSNGRSTTSSEFGNSYWYYIIYLSPYGNQIR